MNSILRWMENAAALFLGAIMLLIAATAVTRYLFNTPIPDAETMVRMLLGATISWGLAVACQRDEHIRVDLLWERLSRTAQKSVDIGARLVTMLVMVVLAAASLTRMRAVQNSGETSYDLLLPLWPFYVAITLGLIASALVMLRLTLPGAVPSSPEAHHD